MAINCYVKQYIQYILHKGIGYKTSASRYLDTPYTNKENLPELEHLQGWLQNTLLPAV